MSNILERGTAGPEATRRVDTGMHASWARTLAKRYSEIKSNSQSVDLQTTTSNETFLQTMFFEVACAK